MMPYLNPGDKVIASNLSYFFIKPKRGDVVVFRYNNKILIKRIVKVSNDTYDVYGDNKSDSLKIRPIRKSHILGKVLFKLAVL